MESVFTWNDLFKLVLLLVGLYGLLNLIARILIMLSKKIRTKRFLRTVSERALIFYIPLGICSLIAVYVGINFLVHGILVLVVGIIFFPQVRAYLNGILFRSNSFVRVGENILFEDYAGTIERFQAFGVILDGLDGKRFINYTHMYRSGFSVKKKHDDLHHQVLHLTLEEKKTDVLDLLFENPLVNLNHLPELKKVSEPNEYKLRFTLEKGATVEELVTFLLQYGINSTIKTPQA